MNQDINFIVDQIIFLSIYNDKNIVVRPNVVEVNKEIYLTILTMLRSPDNFTIYSSLREIREALLKEEISLDDAILEVQISLMLREEKYTKRDNPKLFLSYLHKEIKATIVEFTKGNPVELPIKLYQDLGIDVFSYTIQNKWKESNVSSDKEKKIESILDRFDAAKNDSVRQHVRRELQDTPIEFIDELMSLSDKDLNERLEEWSDYDNELGNVFEGVAQEGVFNEVNFKKYQELYMSKELTNDKLTRIRDKYTNSIYELFRKYGNPNNYKGKKKIISKKYIRKTLLPFIMYFYNKSNKNKNEEHAYKGYMESTMKSLKLKASDPIDDILNRYTPAKDNKVREYVAKVLHRTPSKIVLELSKLETKALNDISNEKLNYDTEMQQLLVDMKDSNFKGEEFQEYVTSYTTKEQNDDRLKSLRDDYANALYDIMKKYGVPSRSSFPAKLNVKYIRGRVLPYILYVYNRQGKYPLESYVYGAYMLHYLNSLNVDPNEQPEKIHSLLRKTKRIRESIPIKQHIMVLEEKNNSLPQTTDIERQTTKLFLGGTKEEKSSTSDEMLTTKIDKILDYYSPARDPLAREYAKNELQRVPSHFIERLYNNKKLIEKELGAHFDYDYMMYSLYEDMYDMTKSSRDSFMEFVEREKNKNIEFREKYAQALVEVYKEHTGYSNLMKVKETKNMKYFRDKLLLYVLYYFHITHDIEKEYLFGSYLTLAVIRSQKDIKEFSLNVQKLVKRFLKSREKIPINQNACPLWAIRKKDIESRPELPSSDGPICGGLMDYDSNLLQVVSLKEKMMNMLGGSHKEEIEMQEVNYFLVKPKVEQEVQVNIGNKIKKTRVKQIIDRNEDPVNVVDLIVLKDDSVAAIIAGKWELLYEDRDHSLNFL